MRGAAVAWLAVLLAGAPAQEPDERELLIACLEGSEQAAELLPEAEGTAASPGESALADLRRRLTALEREAAQASETLERVLQEARVECAEVAVAPAPPLEAELVAALDRQAALVERACGSGDARAARRARETAAGLRERVDRALARSSARARAPAAPGLEALGDRVEAVAAEAATALDRNGHAERVAARVAALLQPCVGRGESSEQVADLLERLARLKVVTLGADAAGLEALRRRAGAIVMRLEERAADQGGVRDCLAHPGRLDEGGHATRLRRAELERLVGEAEAAARRAERCAEGLGDSAFPARESPQDRLRPLPDVVGLSARDARTALEAAGFRVLEVVGGEPPEPTDAGTVAEQSPAAGSELKTGAEVTLTIFPKRERQREEIR